MEINCIINNDKNAQEKKIKSRIENKHGRLNQIILIIKLNIFNKAQTQSLKDNQIKNNSLLSVRK